MREVNEQEVNINAILFFERKKKKIKMTSETLWSNSSVLFYVTLASAFKTGVGLFIWKSLVFLVIVQSLVCIIVFEVSVSK